MVLTKAEAVARLTGHYTGNIATFDQIHKHVNGMSDAIVAGIVKQFPHLTAIVADVLLDAERYP